MVEQLQAGSVPEISTVATMFLPAVSLFDLTVTFFELFPRTIVPFSTVHSYFIPFQPETIAEKITTSPALTEGSEAVTDNVGQSHGKSQSGHS